jgi:putative flippase GtrA
VAVIEEEQGVATALAGRARRLERWAEDALTWLEERLPARVRRVIPRELLGFAILGGCTFLIDLVLLAALHLTPLPLPVDISIAYVSAFSLNYLLNRTVNFRSHAPVGRQVLKYAVVAAGDFGMTLGITTGLADWAGVDFRLARLTAATCVAVFTYSASRWWVFRDATPSGD